VAGEGGLRVGGELGSGAEAAFGQLGELAGRPAVTLRVAVSDYLGKGLLAPVLRDLLDEEPPVRFEIVTTHSPAGVRLVAAGDVDLAVVTGQENPPGLEGPHLLHQPLVWISPPRTRPERAPAASALRSRSDCGASPCFGWPVRAAAARCSTTTSRSTAFVLSPPSTCRACRCSSRTSREAWALGWSPRSPSPRRPPASWCARPLACPHCPSPWCGAPPPAARPH